MYTHLCLPDEPSCLEAGHKVQVQRLEETAGKSQKGVWLGMWWGDPEVGTNKLCGRLGPSSRDCRHMWASRNLHKRYIFLFAEKGTLFNWHLVFSILISLQVMLDIFLRGRRSTWALWNSRSWAFGTSHCETCPIWRICREAPGCSRQGRSFFVCLILGWKSMILCKGSWRFPKLCKRMDTPRQVHNGYHCKTKSTEALKWHIFRLFYIFIFKSFLLTWIKKPKLQRPLLGSDIGQVWSWSWIDHFW